MPATCCWSAFFHLLGLLLAALAAAAIGGSAMLTGAAAGALGAIAGAGVAAGGMMLGVVVFTVLWAPADDGAVVRPALVMLHEVAPLDAMRLSARLLPQPARLRRARRAALRAGVGGDDPAGLGMLVLVPMIAGALYAAWRRPSRRCCLAPAARPRPQPGATSGESIPPPPCCSRLRPTPRPMTQPPRHRPLPNGPPPDLAPGSAPAPGP